MIKVWDYLAEYNEIKHEILEAVDRVFSSGRLVMGGEVASFEDEFAAKIQTDHCVGVDNGTNAIVLALEAAGVGPGDEVITVPNTAAPTVLAITAVGAVPRFVDVNETDYLLDTDQLDAAITDRTRAIVPVHLYGQCVDMDAVTATAVRYGLKVIEDCAQSHGAVQNGKVSGSMSDTAAFSFYPTKVLGAYGDGGAVTTDSDEAKERLHRLRYYGMKDHYFVENLPGHNSRLDEVQAAILRVKLGRMDQDITARQRVAETYHNELSGLPGIALPKTNPANNHVYYVYVVRHQERGEVMKALKDQGVMSNISYPWPCHLQDGFRPYGYIKGDFPVAERLADEVFSLPMHPGMSDASLEHVCTSVQRAIKAL